MIKLRKSETMRGQAFAAVEYVDAHAKSVLTHPGTPMSGMDGALLANVREGIEGDLRDLEQLFALTLTPAASEAAFQIVSKLVLRSHLIGTSTINTPEAERWRGAVRTMQMRQKRADKPERVALREAIQLEHGDSPAPRANKEAAAILSAVNQRLQASGFKPVKVDAIRRELEKNSPRSSRAQK